MTAPGEGETGTPGPVEARALVEWDAEVAELCKEWMIKLIGVSEERAIGYLEICDSINPSGENRYSRNELEEALDVLRAERQKLAEVGLEDYYLHGQIYNRMLRLIFAVITVTDACALISASYEHQSNHAAYMRELRSKRPETLAIPAIIKQLHGDGPSARPDKDAAAILDPVNARLQSLGYKPVTIAGIAYHLRKIPSS
jgi:hypothetical protein